MAFSKLNDPSVGTNPASFTDQAKLDKVEIDILVAGYTGTGVLSGCAVTAQGSPDMTVAVAAGTVAVSGVTATVTAGNVTITTADATNPRKDLVVSSAAGVLSAVAGTAAAVPCLPNVPASSVALAEVYVSASATTITTARITDKRAVMAPNLAAGIGDKRTITADVTLDGDDSWGPVDYFEIASGAAFELGSGAVVEVMT